MSLTHALKWNIETETFQCKWGACSFEVTWERLADVGYKPFKDGVIFVAEEDFVEGK